MPQWRDLSRILNPLNNPPHRKIASVTKKVTITATFTRRRGSKRNLARHMTKGGKPYYIES